MSTPAFQRIKDYLLEQIQSGAWKEGAAIPSEAMLAEQFAVSRMTVNRAVRELTTEQILTRIQGSGTYVAQQKYQATLVEIKSIAEEIRARGHVHTAELHLLVECAVPDALVQQFQLKPGAHLFHSLIVHFENEIPIQVEDRWVNPAIAPEYLHQDFVCTTPNEYLVAVAPLEGVDYRIEALPPTPNVAAMLKINAQDACLVLQRKTRSRGSIATIVTMWHPGQRYRFTGSF